MFDESTICPYSGLRSFSEEESIFFKGRDKQIDQITSLLEKNKFLMVTGASGEGKSSLVYAGMIPNAKAGFFQAHYNNWQVVDFRPERTPLTNLSKALAGQLNYENHETVETELQRGYSALVDLYKNSPWYYDKKATATKELSEEEQHNAQRKAANLLIIVDQFEEFFTNPENYSQNSPSEAAQVTLNVLLETAKTALAEDLPIYVVCTMRSDFIGQCSAFRGLPEAIGFSQFFVPRLKRNELKLIIEEPAHLNGNKISKRLTERLLYDLSEGIDQLPILQHALSHIWHAADNGKEEMDLIHYALVGGMPADELPDEDKARFRQWFKSLPEYQRTLYHQPGIKKIIEIHANQLYEGAYTYYKKHHPNNPITLHDAKHIVAMTFACLTKIDDSRAVRNRMSLKEITGIINKPQISTQVVNEVLNIFREQDNSFIRPFINDDSESRRLAPNTVLDITHESLIRNWDLLNKWANKEYEYYVTFLDFKKQLARWLTSGKSKDYLLPIGPLSYFEAWEEECKPNKYWLERYRDKAIDDTSGIDESEKLLANAHEYLKKSNRKVLIARTFMRYGANRIAAVIGVIVVLFLSGFYFYDAETKKNEHVLAASISKADGLLDSKDIEQEIKADYLLVKERSTPGSMLSYLNKITDEQKQLKLVFTVYQRLLYYDKKFAGKAKDDLLRLLNEHLAGHNNKPFDDDVLLELNKLGSFLAYDYYYNNNPAALELLQKGNEQIYDGITNALKEGNSLAAEQINQGLQFYLTFNKPEEQKVDELIELMSPFSGAKAKNTFNTLYPKTDLEANGRIKLNFNGGYHTLASLYAVSGEYNNLLRALDSLNINKDYFVGIPYNSAANLIGYLYQYGHQDHVQTVVKRVVDYANKPELAVWHDLLDRSGYLKYLYSSNLNQRISESNAGFFGPNLCFLKPETVSLIYTDVVDYIKQFHNADKRNFELAQLNKQHAIFNFKYNFDRGFDPQEEDYDPLFNMALQHYRQVGKPFLSQEVNITYTYYGGGLRERKMTNKERFIYPDFMEGYMSNTYHAPLYLHYLHKNNLLPELYKTNTDWQLLNYFVGNYNEVFRDFWELTYQNNPEISKADMENIKAFIASQPAAGNYDLNLINIILANTFFGEGKVEEAMGVYKELKVTNYPKTAKQFEYLNEQFFLNQIATLAENLVLNGFYHSAAEQTEALTRTSFKILGYIRLAEKLYEQNYNPISFAYLDSAYNLIKTVKERDLKRREDYRDYQIYVLSKIGGEKAEQLIKDIIKSKHELIKITGMLAHVNGYATVHDYYMATRAISPSLTETGELFSYTNILYQDILRKESPANKVLWSGFDRDLKHVMYYKFNVRGL